MSKVIVTFKGNKDENGKIINESVLKKEYKGVRDSTAKVVTKDKDGNALMEPEVCLNIHKFPKRNEKSFMEVTFPASSLHKIQVETVRTLVIEGFDELLNSQKSLAEIEEA